MGRATAKDNGRCRFNLLEDHSVCWNAATFDVFMCSDGSRFDRWLDNHHIFIPMAGYAAASHMTRLLSKNAPHEVVLTAHAR